MRVTDLLNLHRVFLDTAPVIYFIEKNPLYAPKLLPVFNRLDEGDVIAGVSPITLAECLVIPYKLGKPEIVQVFSDLMVNSPSVRFFPLDEIIADKAAELRARYNLTLTDAFQVAVAVQSECEAFLTNDSDLKRVTELPIIIVKE